MRTNIVGTEVVPWKALNMLKFFRNWIGKVLVSVKRSSGITAGWQAYDHSSHWYWKTKDAFSSLLHSGAHKKSKRFIRLLTVKNLINIDENDHCQMCRLDRKWGYRLYWLWYNNGLYRRLFGREEISIVTNSLPILRSSGFPKLWLDLSYWVKAQYFVRSVGNKLLKEIKVSKAFYRGQWNRWPLSVSTAEEEGNGSAHYSEQCDEICCGW